MPRNREDVRREAHEAGYRNVGLEDRFSSRATRKDPPLFSLAKVSVCSDQCEILLGRRVKIASIDERLLSAD